MGKHAAEIRRQGQGFNVGGANIDANETIHGYENRKYNGWQIKADCGSFYRSVDPKYAKLMAYWRKPGAGIMLLENTLKMPEMP